MLEIVNRPLIRVLMVALPALAVQTTLLTEMRVDGVVLQIMLLMAVAGGVAGGPERGALVGFATGILFDLSYPAQPLGLTALVFGLAGFLAGYINSLTADHPWWLTMLVVGIASALGTVLYPVVALVVGVDGLLTTGVIRIAIIVGISNGLFAVGAMPVMRWCLRIKKGGIVMSQIEVVPL